MKARKKGDAAPFEDVYQIVIGRGLYAKYIPINDVEFEQECKNSNHSEDHWQDLRERVAIAAMQGMLASGRWSDKRIIAEYSVEYADAIVEILKGE